MIQTNLKCSIEHAWQQLELFKEHDERTFKAVNKTSFLIKLSMTCHQHILLLTLTLIFTPPSLYNTSITSQNTTILCKP